MTDTPQGYWVGHVSVSDPARFGEYQAAAGPVIATFGGQMIVRGGQAEIVEGPTSDRTVVIAFPSYATALECYRSDAYQATLPLRNGAVTFNLTIVEG